MASLPNFGYRFSTNLGLALFGADQEVINNFELLDDAFGTITGHPGGTTGQVQYNDAGVFGGIPEGTAGQVLTSNGVGIAPSFQAGGGGGPTGPAGGVLSGTYPNPGFAPSPTFTGTANFNTSGTGVFGFNINDTSDGGIDINTTNGFALVTTNNGLTFVGQNNGPISFEGGNLTFTSDTGSIAFQSLGVGGIVEIEIGSLQIDNALLDGTQSAGTSGQVLTSTGTGVLWATIAEGGGTVTSVALSAPTGFTITGSPVTTSGTLAFVMPTGWATGALLLGNGAASVASLGIGSTGNVLTVSGGTAVWAAPATSGTVTSVSFTGGLISVATPTTTPALTVAGTSGGIPYFSSASTWATSAALAATGLIIGGGAGAAPVTSAQLTFVAPTLTVGLAGTSSGVLALTGSTSGSATITAPATAGTTTNAVVSSNNWQAPALFVTAATGAANIGASSTAGFYVASGRIDILVGAAASFEFGNGNSFAGGSAQVMGFTSTTNPAAGSTDTAFSRVSAGVIGVGTGASGSVAGTLSASSVILGAPTGGSEGSGTVNVSGGYYINGTLINSGTVTSVSFTGGLISVATPTTTPALTVAGTSGGIPYFSSASTWASSALLASGGVVLGGGAGSAPLTNTQLTFSAPTLTVGLAGTSSGILALTGSTSGSATITAPAVADTNTNYVAISNVISAPVGAVGSPSFSFTGHTTYGLFYDSTGGRQGVIVAVNGGTQAAIFPGGIEIQAGNLFSWAPATNVSTNADTGLSRVSAGVVGVGTGAQGSVAGTLSAGVLIASAAGAASTPSVSITGVPITGGTTTTTTPLVYINSGGAVGSWTTFGTVLGINAPSGFTGNLVDFHVNGGTTVFEINNNGAMTMGVAGSVAFVGRANFNSPADGVIKFSNNAGTSFTRIDFGGTTSSFVALQSSGTTLTVGTADGGTAAGALTVSGVLTGNAGATLGVVGTTSGVLTLAGSTSGTCTLTAPAVAGTTTNLLTSSNAFAAPSLSIGAPTGGNEGAGTINAAGAYYSNGTVGVSAGSFSAVTAITTVGGIVTQLTGTSDERLKDAEPYEGGLDEILAIHPVRFSYNEAGQKHTGLPGDKKFVGFLAQDVQRAIPEAITGTEGEEGYLSFDPRPVIAALVNAVKQLSARIAELEKKG